MTDAPTRPDSIGQGPGLVSRNIDGYIDDVTHLMDVYEQRMFPGEPTAHRTEPATAALLLRCLLSGLLHYTDARGLDFNEALEIARGIRTDDIAAEATYQIGEEVQTRYGPTLRGTITGIGTGEIGQPLYEVHVPGEAKQRTLEAVEISQAPPFGPVTTRSGDITTAAMAERMLIHLGARIRHGEAGGPPVTRDHYGDRERLLAALATWSCKPKKTIRRSLGPKEVLAYGEMTKSNLGDITAATPNSPQQQQPAAANGPKTQGAETRPDQADQAAELAASDFPYDISAGVPAADAAPAAHPAVRAAGRRPGTRRI
jgi:hypothetical protein